MMDEKSLWGGVAGETQDRVGVDRSGGGVKESSFKRSLCHGEAC